MKKLIKIFLASSGELKPERDKISSLIRKKNDSLIKKNIYLELVLWEELRHSFTVGRIQDYFNQELLKCDIFVAIFFKKIGQYTREEFEKAYSNLKAGKNIKFIFVFFKEGSTKDINSDYIEVLKFKEIIKEYKQLFYTYENIDTLKNKFMEQIDLVIDELSKSKEIEYNNKIDTLPLPSQSDFNNIHVIIEIDKEGNVLNDNSELLALLSESYYYVKKVNAQIDFEIIFEKIEIIKKTIQKLDLELNSNNRVKKIELLGLYDGYLSKIQVFKQSLLMAFQKPIFDYFLSGNDLFKIVLGLAYHEFGPSEVDISSERHRIDIFRDKRDLQTSIRVSELEASQIALGYDIVLLSCFREKLYNLPKQILLDKALPAILLKVTRQKQKNSKLDLNDILDFNTWLVGLG